MPKWWEATSLQKYLDCNQVPRGLRIFTTPTFANPNPAMLEQWTENSARCTTGMLEILVKFAWSDRQQIVSEIDLLMTDIKCQDTEANLNDFIEKMEKWLEKIEEDIKTHSRENLFATIMIIKMEES